MPGMETLTWRAFWTRVGELLLLGGGFAIGYYGVKLIDWLTS